MLSTRNLKAGDVLDGRYRLERRVGGGGMGDVWEATDTTLWRTVAVKILLAGLVDDRGFRERFRREARAIAVMKGPGVVEVYDYGEIDHGDAAIAYLIMEYVDGKPLSRLLGLWGKLGSADTLRIVGGVAEALQVAHDAGIVHRDIKPGNILVRDNGSVVLVDFGIARVSHNLTLTTTGVVLGTVTYMSPEQAAGENLTAASDLYSLGVVAHQCLAGSPPFKADTPLGVLSAHLRKAPPPLPPEVPDEVGDIVSRALAKEPSARWANAAAFAEACHRTRAMITSAKADIAPPPVETRVQTPPNAPTFHTGPHTGANPAPRPAGTAQAAPADIDPSRRRRRLWATLAGTLTVIAVGGAIAAASPWRDQAGAMPFTVVDDTEVHGQDGEEPPPAADDEDAPPVPGGESEEADTSPAADEKPDVQASSPPSGLEPTAGPTPSQSPSPSPSPSPESTVAVPNVTGLTQAEAQQKIEAVGLAANFVYNGEGEHQCGVVGQSPSAGAKVSRDSTVDATVKKAANADACMTESGETEAPGDL